MEIIIRIIMDSMFDKRILEPETFDADVFILVEH